MMQRLYFHSDSRRGAEKTFSWLKEEINELGEAMESTDTEALKNEFADVIAWVASLANLLEINLERAVLEKYPNRCPKCNLLPCRCHFR
ncbi:MAG: nucleotide pyrophosphohydrolase [Candidatus Bathyarchaeota archaeon]|nr:MAG: nucleotide pyrophosphohydrolase [Candidatus Bathyarchaeota archaeon]